MEWGVRVRVGWSEEWECGWGGVGSESVGGVE